MKPELEVPKNIQNDKNRCDSKKNPQKTKHVSTCLLIV